MRNFRQALLVLLLLPGSVIGQAAKIGVIDFQGAAMNSNPGIDAAQQIQDRINELDADLAVTQAELQAAQQRYETQQRALSASALAQLEAEITRIQTRFVREQEDATLEIEEFQAELLNPISERIQEIVLEFAEAEGYTMILDPSAVVYASEAANITDEVIERINAGNAAPAEPPAPPAESGQ